MSISQDQDPSMTVVKVRLRDGLLAGPGFVARSPYACVIYCRVPLDWLEADRLPESRLERVYDMLYGPSWRDGNSDGSAYMVLSCEQARLAPEAIATREWLGLVNDKEQQFWFCRPSSDGRMISVKAEEL